MKLLRKLVGTCPNSGSHPDREEFFMDRGLLDQKPAQLLSKWKEIAERELLRPVFRREQAPPTRSISVIIPAHNEEAYLGRTLDCLKRQMYPHMEVIVVANGCTDSTAQVARGGCDRLIVLSQKSLGVARNLGARMAKGDILLFLDADTMLSPSALRKIAREFRPEHAAGTVKGNPDDPALGYRMVYLLKNTVHKLRLHPGSSGVILCWREHFLKCGGFDEGLEVRENSELMRRLLQFGRYKYVRAAEATTSMRRYEQKGIGRMIWLWIKVWFESNFGDLHQRRYETVR